MDKKSGSCGSGCRSSNCVYPRSAEEDPWAKKILPKGDSLSAMVEDYKKNFLERTENWIGSLNTITDFICGAANIEEEPKDEKFCKNSHQYRMPYATVVKAREELRTAELGALTSFVEIYRAVKLLSKEIEQFGELAAYDFTQRYCYSRNILPDAVYLHAGVAGGYKALNAAGVNVESHHDELLGYFIKPVDIPEPLSGLSTLHIENFLCIYKHQLERLSNKH